ncbi:tRNA (N6-threonylcarbamoyladenosine(37)-N6)-methyltransferase TrmO [Candidatus Bathyarchaeota archaeon]|nr:tRNA (N6-threonylcarbamoyladenosine(37)-N6)-methyltransferase TrmO [Candidatus Bathyarchaeota archaeon]
MLEHGNVIFIGTVETTGETSTLRIYPEFRPALLGIERYSHLIVLYWFHLRDNPEHRKTLQVTPPRHEGAPLTGVFACRSPSRPNPIGVTVVKIERIEGCKLMVSGLDALDGSPIVDLKPYNPDSDSVPEAEAPGYMRHL